jgi:hypothetical protein
MATEPERQRLIEDALQADHHWEPWVNCRSP